MKITTTKTTVIAEAESIAEALVLIKLAGESTHVEHPKRPYAKRQGGNNAWKGKHKVLCPTCGLKYKNIKLHAMRKHPHLTELDPLTNN